MMKTIKVKVVENGHRYHTLMNLLRQDNYDFSIEAETEQAKISSNPMLADSVCDHDFRVWKVGFSTLKCVKCGQVKYT